MAKHMRLFLLLAIVLLAGIFNWRFIQHCDLEEILKMNDVRAILSGFQKTPNLLVDGLRWWHGTWIQEGINAFRPLASYLYWVECWIGLHYGFLWVGILGFILFVVCCCLSTELAWRVTNSIAGAFLGAIFVTTIVYHNFNPPHWLAWFPCHQELMVSAFLISALLCFDWWFTTGSKKHLACAWALFIAGCLTKEYAYVFPLFTASVVMLRPKRDRASLLVGFAQTAAMLVFVLALWFYRDAVLENPRNPTLKAPQLIRKPLLFMFNVFGRYLLAGDYWFVGWAILIFVLVGIYIRWVRANPSATLLKSFVWTIIFVALNWVYLRFFAPPPVSDAVLFLLDQPFVNPHFRDMASMLFQLYALYLLWRYRDREPTALSFTFVFLAHLPVLDYIGWHYTLSAWFFWSAYWALVAKLIWLNLGQPTAQLKHLSNFATASDANLNQH